MSKVINLNGTEHNPSIPTFNAVVVFIDNTDGRFEGVSKWELDEGGLNLLFYVHTNEMPSILLPTNSVKYVMFYNAETKDAQVPQ